MIDRELDMLVAELESENRLLRREIERLEARLAAHEPVPMPAPQPQRAPWPFPAPGEALM